MSLSATFRYAKIPRLLPPKSGEAAASSPSSVACTPGRPSEQAATAEIPRALPPKSGKAAASSSASAACTPGRPSAKAATAKGKAPSGWSVYLIASSRIPRTYVGVTNDFPRRLRQHNGELKGGAKASSAGRPWNLACLVEGFVSRSEACEFESKWKNISRKMGRKRSEPCMTSLLQHRDMALSRVKTYLSCSHLKIKWHSS